MIRADSLSYTYTIIAAMVAVYLATFEMGVTILFPVVLLTTGVALRMYLARKVEADDSIDVQEGGQILFYTVLCLAALSLTSFFVSSLPSLPEMQLTGFDTILFGMLMAVAEEQFFRGAVLSFLMGITMPIVAIIGSACIFAVYHLAVYGTDIAAMTYVFVGGIVLSWVTYRSQRLSPSMTAHILNNVMASVM